MQYLFVLMSKQMKAPMMYRDANWLLLFRAVEKEWRRQWRFWDITAHLFTNNSRNFWIHFPCSRIDSGGGWTLCTLNDRITDCQNDGIRLKIRCKSIWHNFSIASGLSNMSIMRRLSSVCCLRCLETILINECSGMMPFKQFSMKFRGCRHLQNYSSKTINHLDRFKWHVIAIKIHRAHQLRE